RHGAPIIELGPHRFPQSEGALVVGEGRRGASDRQPALPDPRGQVPVLLPGQRLVESAQLLEKTAFEEAGRLDAVVTQVAGALQRLGRGPEAAAGRDLRDYGRPKAEIGRASCRERVEWPV